MAKRRSVDLDKELREAVGYHGSDAASIELLEKGARPNAKYSDTDDSPLCYAAMYGRFGAVKALVERGALVNHVGEYGRTPLIYAAAKSAPMVEYLLDHHADLSARTEGDDDALIESCTYGDLPDVARLLIARGLPLVRHAKDPGWNAPRSHLQWAASCRRVGVVGVLLDHGCDANEYGTLRQRVCLDAISIDPPKGNDVAHLLLERGLVPDAEFFERICSRRDASLVALALAKGAKVAPSSLSHAARAGDLDVLTVLIEADAAIDGDAPETPLMTAARAGHLPIIDRLLACGADVARRDRHGASALHYAAGSGELEVLDRILAAGAALDEIDRRGRTALFYASEINRPEMARALIERGLDVNARDEQDMTPLMVAVGFLQVSQVLREHGADPDLVDKAGMTVATYEAKNAEENAAMWENR